VLRHRGPFCFAVELHPAVRLACSGYLYHFSLLVLCRPDTYKSRAAQAHPGKVATFVLDFVNESLSSELIQQGLLNILVGPAGLYDELRKRSA
jgi:hypothetical protein